MDDEAESRILEKAAYIDQAVTVLSRKRELNETEYLADREQRAIVEREFQTAIEACIDIAEIIIKDCDEPMPETNAGKFALLGELDVLSTKTDEKMQEAAGFRNVLSHRYGPDIDDIRVYRNLQNHLRWFPGFLEEVREFLPTCE